MSQDFYIQELENGLMLLGQKMTEVSSVSLSLNIPIGASFDPPELAGASSVLAEWCMRGAGGRNSRKLNEALDSLGCQHNESVRSHFMSFSMALLGRNLGKAIPLLGDIVRKPHFEDEAFEACRALVQQDLESLEDEPARKANMILRERFFPQPLCRCIYGTPETLSQMTSENIRRHTGDCLGPDNSILAVAGNFDWNELLDMVTKNFGGWSKQKYVTQAISASLEGQIHIEKDSAQSHITLAHKAITSDKPEYYTARMAEMILSGGMSSRLFTEVREKRGLVYHVSTQYVSLKDHAGMFTYAGTVPEKAQETFDVTLKVLKSLADGITNEELTRARTQLKSALVMQGESTISRSAALAGDWYYLKKLRTLNEIAEAIEKISVDDVISYVKKWPAKDFAILVIGPEMIKIN